jgi:hypothetical protein
MVTATTMQVTMTGLRSRRKYAISGYISDVIGAKVLWNQNGAAGATSDNYFQLQEDVVLTDIAVLTGPTVMTGFVIQTGGQTIPGSTILISPNLTTNAQRSVPTIGFKTGSLIGATQF